MKSQNEAIANFEPRIIARFDMGENVVADVMATRFGNFAVLVVDLDANDSLSSISTFTNECEAIAHAADLGLKATGEAKSLPVVYAN